MSSGRAHLGWGTLFVAFAACSSSHVTTTEVVVVIDAEPSIRVDAARVRVRVTGGTTGSLSERLDETIPAGPTDWPLHVAVLPLEGDATRVFRVTAQALDADDSAIGNVQVLTGFLRGRALVMRLVLEECCRDMTCGAEQTCRECECTGDYVAPETLSDFGVDGGTEFDAGAEVDGGTEIDGGAPDAGGDARFDAWAAECGNGAREGSEECDDMNDLSGDGCSAGCTIEPAMSESPLAPPTPTAEALFGCAVALTDDASRALVGSDGSETAQVFVRTGSAWTLENTLVASAPGVSDLFGHAVALSSDGTRALVGSPEADVGGAGSGSARIFLRTDTVWAEEEILVAADGAAADRLGRSVSLSAAGDLALVGAWSDDVGAVMDAGSARVFRRTDLVWSEEAMLVAESGAREDWFGASVALSADGTRALVGASGFDSGAEMNAGRAIVFVWTGSSWMQEAVLTASVVGRGDYFGESVALSADGSRAVVGSRGDDNERGLDAGSVHVYVRSGTLWTQEATLLASDGAEGDWLGGWVALSADARRLLAGAYHDSTPAGGVWAGSARVFLRRGTTWGESSTIFAPDGAANDEFGESVALSGDGRRALVGAAMDDHVTAGSNAGSARVFVVPGP